MLKFVLDRSSLFHVRWPRSDADVIRLAQALLAAEAKLDEADRFPKLDLIQQRTQAAIAAREKAQSAEATRSAISSAEQQALEQARMLVRKIIAGLTYRYLEALPTLERWGINVVQTRNGYRTRTPKHKPATLEMLNRYVAYEQSLPEAERLADPPLETVIAVRDALQAAVSGRQSARTQREVGVMTRSAETRALRNLLQLAAIYHAIIDFDGLVDSRLRTFGLRVIGPRRQATAHLSAAIVPDAGQSSPVPE